MKISQYFPKLCFLVTPHNATVRNGIFQGEDREVSVARFQFNFNSTFAHARAADVMSTQSAMGFEWSVKLIGDKQFYVGIASVLNPRRLCEMDLNAILYYSNGTSPVIQIGTRVIHSNLLEQKTGDVIHFKFQPQTKKLVIELVRHFYRFE